MGTENVNMLPIILVSAKDETSANLLISELIDNVPENTDDNGDSSNKNDKIWRLVNKYYTADVRLHPLGDQQELDPDLADLIEAHIIYLSPDEVGAGAQALQRRARAGAGAGVRLLAAACRAEPAGLAAAAARARYELVPLLAAADADAGPPRLRAALHAHVWPGPRAADGWAPWCAAPADERADPFAAALGALPAAAAAARAPAPRAERLARAELVLAAFCRAVGQPLD